jgi:phenylacetate-coenzyme A ligase PaaK-like adenylate-forming protein
MMESMWFLPDPWFAASVAFDVALVPGAPSAALTQRRQRRLEALLDAARGSAFYRERFARHGSRLEQQPPVTKEALMLRFDDWVTDPRLNLAALRRFIADPARIGQAFEGGYTVWESSGSTGVSGVFVQDTQAMAVYDTLEALRRPASAAWRRCADPFFAAERIAFVGATGGHFASTVSLERLRRLLPGMARRLRGFSLLQPRRDLLAALSAWQPTLLATYPTAALMLAEEAEAGRLDLPLAEVLTGGEALSEAVRAAISRGLCCPVHASYGASEFLALASECDQQHLHLNSDWAILEPVDASGRPVPDGEPGHTVLLTNLANHVQPLIRYDLGDRVRLDPKRCACGSALPVVEVQGRVDDALLLTAADGHGVRLPPLALTTVLEEDAGLFDFQLVQEGPRQLDLTVVHDGGEAALACARRVLIAHLRAQGLTGLRLEVQRGVPQVQGRTGKLPRVVNRCAVNPAPDPAKGERQTAPA